MAERKSAPGIQALINSGALLAGSDPSLVVRYEPTGIPQLDTLLGGGFAYRRITMIVGPEGTGKTLVAQYAVAAVQRAGKRAALIDTELSYTAHWWARSGVDTDSLWVVRTPTGEAAIDAFESVLESGVGIVVVDSLAALVPTQDIEVSTEAGKQIGTLARLVNLLCRKALAKCMEHETIILLINQTREGFGPGAAETYPGGRGQRFYAHSRLRTSRDDYLKDKDGNRIGWSMRILAQKNKPGEEQGMCIVSAYYTEQIDVIQCYVDDAINSGLIIAKGAWYTYGEIQFHGKAALREYFVANPEMVEGLRNGGTPLPIESVPAVMDFTAGIQH